MITSEPRVHLLVADMRLAGIPENYWKATLRDFPDGYLGLRPCLTYCEKLVENLQEGFGLMLMGAMGHGKTHAAVSILKKALAHNAYGLFLEVSRITEARIRRTAFDGDTDQTLMQRAEKVDILVLDDLGCEHSSDFAHQTIEALVRGRIFRNKSILITTNMTKNLKDLYGPGTISALHEKVYPLKFEGQDWRSKKAEELKRRFSCRDLG